MKVARRDNLKAARLEQLMADHSVKQWEHQMADLWVETKEKLSVFLLVVLLVVQMERWWVEMLVMRKVV